MTQAFDLAVVGVSSLSGRTIVELLQEREFPIATIYLLDDEDYAGEIIRFNGKSVRVQNVEDFDWSQVPLAIFNAGAAISERFATQAADEGVIVIDNSGYFNFDYDVPLVIPEVNADSMADFRNRNIIASPTCLTIQMLVALKPIYDVAGLERINVTTYQSVSGSGKKGIDELAGQTVKLFNSQDAEPEVYAKQIAFNCLPMIDELLDNGYTKEEMKLGWETQKILADDSVAVNATCVRVSVFHGHAQALHIECRQPIDAIGAIDLLRRSEGLEVFEQDQYPTQVKEATGKDHVMVGRIRNDISHANGLNMWVVADNIRKGSATNVVQIAELLVRDYL